MKEEDFIIAKNLFKIRENLQETLYQARTADTISFYDGKPIREKELVEACRNIAIDFYKKKLNKVNKEIEEL